MKLLLDENVSPAVTEGLQKAGYDAAHISEYDMRAADDDDVLQRALDEDRVIITSDHHFAEKLVLKQLEKPSVIRLRAPLSEWQPEKVLARLIDALPELMDDLAEGCLVVLRGDSWRVRPLPLPIPKDK